jgi:Ricin-type beta-trefoil lectin domain-like
MKRALIREGMSMREKVLRAVLSLSFLAPVLATPATAQCSTGSCRIYSYLSNKCLQPINGSTVRGAEIVQEACNGGAAQQWTKVRVSGNIFHFVNSLSGLCLDARGRAINGTPVQQWPCNKISNENWEPGEYFTDYVPPLISRVSGTRTHCLDIPGGQTIAGLAMQIYRCNGTAAQEWDTP